MDLTLTIPRDDFSVESLEAAVARFAELVPDGDDVRVVITTDFVGEVRRVIVDDPEYAEAYEQERDMAFAVAKTITQADKSVDLVVEAGLFSLEADPAAALRTFEHEALHVLVERRGESLNDLRSRRGEARESAAGGLSAICGVACEEYRVERALCAMYPDARDDSAFAQFQRVVEKFEQQVRTASIQYQRDHDVEVIARAVMTAFHALATWTAYVAAEVDGGRAIDDLGVYAELDALVLGHPWRLVAAALRTLPPADEPTAFADLEARAEAVDRTLVDWLDHVGFAITDTESGIHFAVHNPEDWVSWGDLL